MFYEVLGCVVQLSCSSRNYTTCITNCAAWSIAAVMLVAAADNAVKIDGVAKRLGLKTPRCYRRAMSSAESDTNTYRQ